VTDHLAGRPTSQPGRAPATEVGLASGPFLGVLALAFLSFTGDSILRAAVPLMVLDRGGDAVVVGLIAAAYALPSIVLRPFIGDLVDTWSHRLLLRLGALGMVVAPFLHLLPGLGLLGVVRLVSGTAWATFSVAQHALMAKLAPVRRRGEAAGYFMAMPALATLVGPGLAVALYTRSGEVVPVVVAAAIGVVVLGLAIVMPVPETARPEPAPDAPAGRPSWRERLVEPSTLPITILLTALMSAHSLFFVFPPVYALAVGAPVEQLAIYYPVYGLVLTVSQLLVGRVSDRLGRVLTIRIGAVVAIAGLAMAVPDAGLLGFAIAGGTYAVAISISSPAISALTIDLAPPNRLGAAVATYTVGYQLATGLSGILWGAIIATFGFPWPFAVAIALQLVALGLTRRFAGLGRRSRASTA
jgi:MFS family permease